MVRDECIGRGDIYPGDDLVPPDVHGEYVPTGEFYAAGSLWPVRLLAALSVRHRTRWPAPATENSLCDARSRFTLVPNFSHGWLGVSAKLQSRFSPPLGTAHGPPKRKGAILSTEARAKIKTRRCQNQTRTTNTQQQIIPVPRSGSHKACYAK
jgi:hypothetical protein